MDLRHPLVIALLALAGCGSESVPEAGVEGWRALRSTDSTGAVVAAFLARDAAATEGETLPASLYLRCTDGAPSVYVDWRAELVADTAEVAYAFDELPETVEGWVASSDRSAAGLWTDSLARPFFERLLSHDRIELSAETASGPRSRVFALDGLDDVAGSFREACGLPGAGEAQES